MDKAKLTVYTPDRGARRLQARRDQGHHRLPVQPQGSDDREDGQVGAQAGQGREERADRRSSRGSDPCKLTLEMFFDATGAKDGTVVEAVEKLFGCCVPTEESAGQKKPTPPLVVLQWGSDHELPGVRHLGQRQVHAVPLRRHADPGHLQRVAGGDARRAAQAEPDLGQRQHPPGRTARSSATPSPRSRTRSTATPRTGARSPRSTASTTRCGCPPGGRSCCPPWRSWG